MSESRQMRVDRALVARSLAPSRSRAQALIKAGCVALDGKTVLKAGQPVRADQSLEVVGLDHPWVSRGGLKLAHGLDHFAIDVEGAVAADIGASTGGFTDVLLSRGARKVYAVDVGRDQLHTKLRADQRVVAMEKVNARHLAEDAFDEPLDIVVSDVSFISLKLALPAALAKVRPGGALVALVKPQFEVGKERLGKGGVVRDKALHKAVCDDLQGWLSGQPGWRVLGVEKSPIIGPDGNVEFLMGGRLDGDDAA